MTFCLGMTSAQGLLAIADTRITSGTEVSRAPKISVHDINGSPIFILTSGLRSARDKAITYFSHELSMSSKPMTRAYEAANRISEKVRQVRSEDTEWLTASGFNFDLHCIIGGQLSADQAPQMFLVYPEGNWVEVNTSTPYVIIGESRYGKPLLDRLWGFDGDLQAAFRIGLLAFTETKASASNVDYPLDVVLFRSGTSEIDQLRITPEDGVAVESAWHDALNQAALRVEPLTEQLFQNLKARPQESIPLIGGSAPSTNY